MKRSIVLAATLAAFAACSSDDSATTASGGVDRVEPPFWWTGFEHGELQIMLHGEDIAGLGASVEYPGVEVARVERGDSPNYLFVYLRIGGQAAPGEFEIVLEDESGQRWRIHIGGAYTPNPRDPEHRQGLWASRTALLASNSERPWVEDSDVAVIEGTGFRCRSAQYEIQLHREGDEIAIHVNGEPVIEGYLPMGSQVRIGLCDRKCPPTTKVGLRSPRRTTEW